MKNLISVSGKKGSGKNLVAAIITDLTYDQAHWEVKSFADKLKYITCSLIGCTREQLEDREFKEKELEEEWWYVKLDNKVISIQEYIDYIKGTTYSFNEKDIATSLNSLVTSLDSYYKWRMNDGRYEETVFGKLRKKEPIITFILSYNRPESNATLNLIEKWNDEEVFNVDCCSSSMY